MNAESLRSMKNKHQKVSETIKEENPNSSLILLEDKISNSENLKIKEKNTFANKMPLESHEFSVINTKLEKTCCLDENLSENQHIEINNFSKEDFENQKIKKHRNKLIYLNLNKGEKPEEKIEIIQKSKLEIKMENQIDNENNIKNSNEDQESLVTEILGMKYNLLYN
jgi:hypothetical protein